MISRPVVFCCGPRAGGNSDAAADAFARGVRAAGGDVRVVKLRELAIAPCLGCGACEHSPSGGCVLSGPDSADQAQELFRLIMAAPFVFFASPIFFYHLPSGFKALIDRAQAHYTRRLTGDPALLSLPRRTAYTALVAGRPRGDKLFDGSLLTLKYFLAVFNYTLAEPLTFRGKDQPGDFAADADAQQQAWAYGTRAWRDAAAG